MKVTEEKLVPTKVITHIMCDRCNVEYDKDDTFQTQEFHSIDFVGGYMSVFGDMSRVQADICQDCLKELIEPFARISTNDWELP